MHSHLIDNMHYNKYHIVFITDLQLQMKEILAVNKVDGFSFNAEIKTAKDFADLFCTMQNVSSGVWHKLYYALT